VATREEGLTWELTFGLPSSSRFVGQFAEQYDIFKLSWIDFWWYCDFG